MYHSDVENLQHIEEFGEMLESLIYFHGVLIIAIVLECMCSGPLKIPDKLYTVNLA